MVSVYPPKGWLASATLIFAASCFDNGQPLFQHQLQEYAVYDAVLSTMFFDPSWANSFKSIRRSGIKEFVIVKRTSLNELPLTATYIPGLESTLETLAPIPEGLVDRLFEDNEVSVDLDSHFTVQVPVTFIEDDEMRELFEDIVHNGWDDFWVRYPQAQGLLMLSRVVFDRDEKTALVYAANGLANLHASGYLILLTRVEGKWLVTKSSMLWVS